MRFFAGSGFVTIGIRPTSTYEKLNSFRHLPDGWHYGKGTRLSDQQFVEAVKMLAYLNMLGFGRTDVFPGADGEVLLTAYHQDHYLGLVLETDGTMSFTHELKKQECCAEDHISRTEARNLLRKVQGEIWPISGSSIQDTTTPRQGNLMTLLSRNRVMEVCPSSTVSVQKELVA